MKDQLDPLGSESAAYLNQLEMSRLDDLGETAQNLLSLLSSHSAALNSIGLLHVPEPVKSIVNSIGQKLTDYIIRSEKINLETFAYLVVNDLQRHGRKIDELINSQRDREIIIMGARRAREASKEKIRRLAQVVASGVSSPEDSEEKILEFLRFASELNETDIYVLNQMYLAQREFDLRDLGVWAMNIRRVMHNKRYINCCGEEIDNQHVRAAFTRLQALGLVQQFGGTASDTGPAEQHYGVLLLGKEFIEYLEIMAS